jgi:hypothetical protein
MKAGRRELERFFRHPQALAARLARRRFSLAPPRVPPGCFGYVVEDDRFGGSIITAGQALAGVAGLPIWVFRDGSVELAFRFGALSTCDGMDLDCRLTLEARIEPRAVDVKLFLGFPELPERLTAPDLAARLERSLLDTFGRRLQTSSAEAAVAMDAAAARAMLSTAGEELFFERGIRLSGVRAFIALSRHLEKLRREALECERDEASARRRLERIELWRRTELQAAAARREVAQARELASGSRTAAQVREEAPAACRVLLAAEKRIFELRIEGGPRPVEVAAIAGGELGEVRSARHGGRQGAGELLLAGAQSGVYLLDSRGGAPELYRLSGGSSPCGGVNAAFLSGERLFATHSDIGLVSWPRGVPGESRCQVLLSRAAIGAFRGVRALQLGNDGQAYFTAGDSPGLFDPGRGPFEVKLWRGAEAELTSLAAGSGDLLVAGTRDGRLFAWDGPESAPRNLGRLASSPVYSLSQGTRDGDLFLAAGLGAPWVYVRSAFEREMTFHAPRPLRWVAVARDILLAADLSGRRLYGWEWSRREMPAFEVHLPERLRDLWAGEAS